MFVAVEWNPAKDTDPCLLGLFFRYKQNNTALQRGMEELGFSKLLSDDCGSYIITAYHYPDHPNFNFEDFYCRLSQLG